MSKSYTLKAEVREKIGKGASRKLRINGKIPAVVYGEKFPPIAIALSYRDVCFKIHEGRFRTTVATLQIGNEEIQVLPKDYQLDPVNGIPVHVDFLRVLLKSVVHVSVPVHFLNEGICPGVKKGGVLNIVRHEIELSVPATAIPEMIKVDLSGCEIGDSVHISSILLPKGVVPVIHDRDFTIATITAPTGASSEEEVGENS